MKKKTKYTKPSYDKLDPDAKKVVDRDRAILAEIKKWEKEYPKLAELLRGAFMPSCVTKVLDYFKPPEGDEDDEKDLTPEDIYNS